MASNGERKIKAFLDRGNFDYQQQFKFNNCKDCRKLPFDFMVIIDGRVGVIEYDGIQHFKIVPIFSSNDLQEASEKFEKQKRHDIIKNQYCRKNNVSMLRISYREDDKIEILIDDFLKKMLKGSRIDIFSNSELYKNPYGDKTAFCCIV